MGAETAGRQRRDRRSLCEKTLSQRAGARFRRARATGDVCRTRYRDVLLAWENEAYLAVKELGPTSSISSPFRQHPRRTAVSVVDQTSTSMARARRPRISGYLYSPQGKSRGKAFYRAILRWQPSNPTNFKTFAAAHRRCGIRRLDQGFRHTFRDMVPSTGSTADRRLGFRESMATMLSGTEGTQPRGILPGFGLTLGSPCCISACWY